MSTNDLNDYRNYVKNRLSALRSAFAKAAIGDFSANIEIPQTEDEFTELYVGVQVMLEVIREQLSQLKNTNENLSRQMLRLEEEISKRTHVEAALKERELKLRLLIEKMPAVLWATDKTLRFTSSQGAGLVHLNLKPDQVVGMTLFEYFGTYDPKFPPISAHRQALNGQHIEYDTTWGERRFSSHVAPLTDIKGNVIGVVGVAIDVTDLKETTRALEAHVAQLKKLNDENAQKKARDEALLSSIGDGVIVTDGRGTITFFNRRAEKLLVWPAAEALGKPIYNVIMAEDEKSRRLPPAQLPFQMALTTGSRVTAKHFYTRRDRSRFPVFVTAAPVVINSKTIGAIDIFRDITHEEEVDRMKTQFITLAAHQLRSPLSNLRWNMELLLTKSKENLPQEAINRCELILANTKRIIAQVNELISAAQVLQGKLDEHPEKVDFVSVVSSEIAETEAAAKEKEVTITLSERVSEIPLLYVDPERLHDVVENVLSNALKFNLHNGQISVGIKHTDSQVRLTVADTGIGIPQSEQGSIFTKFFRATNAREIEGTGLGLFLVKSYVERWGGKIWFQSPDPSSGKGTVFHIELPVQAVA